MKPKFILVIISITLYCTSLYSQKGKFTKGYYIDNRNNRVECLIKDEDWEYNPTQFVYKVDENSTSKIILINDFQEFGIDGFKFKKVTVKIDKTSDRFEDASTVKALNLVEETLLLRVLVEGNFNLYVYKNENYTRFFYNPNNLITQLTYKVYYDSDKKGYRNNETYKQELFNALKCDKITQTDVDYLKYEKEKLTSFFIKYNLCKGSKIVEFKEEKIINTIELYAKAGIGVSNFYDNSYDLDFGSKAKVKLAFETEINFSNRAKGWSFLIEPSYQYYKSSAGPVGILEFEIDYRAVDLSFGLRRYIDLNTKTNVFINAYGTYGIVLSSSKVNYHKDFGKTLNPALGIGLMYNKKYTLEIRYDFDRDVLRHSISKKESKYHTLGVMLGYKFL